jgi:ferredoxin
MPKLTIQGKTFEVEAGTRLVLAIEQTGVNIGHRCGGNARCTTCRVTFQEGEPEQMTEAEYNKLKQVNLYGEARLACQIVVDHDMSVTPLVTAENQPAWNRDTGPAPATEVTPDPATYPIAELEEKVRQ